MNIYSQASNAGFAYFMCRACQGVINNTGAASQQTWLNNVFGLNTTAIRRDATPHIPAYTIWRQAGIVVVALEGARTPLMVSDLYNSVISMHHPRTEDGFLHAAWEAAKAIIDYELNIIDWTSQRIILSGHSFGGSIALAMAAQREFSTNQYPTVVTFGTPRTIHDAHGTLDLAGVDITRWNTTYDAVCRFPPRTNESSMLSGLQTVAMAANLAGWQHVGPGKTVNAIGAVTNELIPPLNSWYTDISLYAFLINNNSPTAFDHNISTYSVNLAQAALADGTLALEPVAGLPQNPGVPIREGGGPPIIPPAAVAAVAAMQQQFVVQAAATANVKPYYWRKTSEGPGVFYNELQVAWFKDKRSARRFANSLNAAYHQWWRSRFASTTALETSVGLEFTL